MFAFQNVMMSIKARISFSVPEILRRDGSAFADWYHHLNVPLTNILREQEEGSDSSSTEQLAWELLSLRESPSGSRVSLDSHDWLGAPLTPVSTQGPWRFETEFTDLTDDEDSDEIQPPGASRLSACLGELEVRYAEGVEEDTETSRNVQRVTRSETRRRTLLTRSVVDLVRDIED